MNLRYLGCYGTKRELLKKLAKIYDPLGLTTPFTIQGKLIYRDICNQKLPWDAQLTRNLTERVKKWEQTLPVEWKQTCLL